MIETEVDQSSSVYCNDCGALIAVNEVDGKKVPCFMCGSTRRNYWDTTIRYVTMNRRKNGDNDKR